MSEQTSVLKKLHSWSPGMTHNEEAWRRRKRCHLRRRLQRCQSDVTDDDVDELRAWFELGFRFDSPDLDPKLAYVFPAIQIYRAVSKLLRQGVSMSSVEMGSADGGANRPFFLGDDPNGVKIRLKQWAQVVACVVQQQSNSQVEILPSSN